MEAAVSQPACFVHRDYHSRNLLITPQNNPGILDFQDAVWGPVTYDLASLLKDCYIAWPPARVRQWALEYRETLLEAGFNLNADAAEFMRWFDLTGLQRHIKVLGIFARLFYRDGKSQYLRDLPRVLSYARDTALSYPETAAFAEFIVSAIDPEFHGAQQRALKTQKAPRNGERASAGGDDSGGGARRAHAAVDGYDAEAVAARCTDNRLIERHVQRLVQAGIERIVINLAWLGGQIRDYLGDGARYGAAITYSEEAPRALDAGGGIFRALPYLSPGPFAVVNGDIYTDFPFQTLAIDAKYDSHLVLVPNPSYLKGDFGFKRRRSAGQRRRAIYLWQHCRLPQRLFRRCPRRRVSHHAAVAAFHGGGTLFRATLYRTWEDVGTPERLAALNAAQL